MAESVNILIEFRADAEESAFAPDELPSPKNNIPSLRLDPEYPPIPMEGEDQGFLPPETTWIRRATIETGDLPILKRDPRVVAVYQDARIAPFEVRDGRKEPSSSSSTSSSFPDYDCDLKNGKGDFDTVLKKIGADRLRENGITGEGIAVGIVDAGLLSAERHGEYGVRNVTDGCPDNWGNRAYWKGHGAMVATTVLAIAPDAELYDIRLSDDALISDAIRGFQWAMDRYQKTGKPHILSNSWGIYHREESEDFIEYASSFDHLFTKKVRKAIGLGMIVVFAAGNCGENCPDSRCGESGPGKSIWGANGLEEVITVGAINCNDGVIGYSSQGPAALHPLKPDICGLSHFNGSDKIYTGTSAACPVVAGAAALLKQANNKLDGLQARRLFNETARQIGDVAGWNAKTGHGLVRVDTAWEKMLDSGGESPHNAV
ncbi:S8 family peptidase [Lewinella sp. IMCC34191]|uniref:S8 family peptidase n=1 Tax=Lewinella sp. IMCC34191 TaxID=2259172 RepID=UPI000E25A5FA|nr:S8 family serine peptidase [Lewinella sp. IMCC34191]